MLDREKLAQIMAANGGELPQLAGGATDKVILRESRKTQETTWGPEEGGEEGAEKGGIGSGQFKFVEINSSNELAKVASTGAIAWPLMDTPKKGEYGTLALVGIAKVECGGTIEAGERVGTTASGTAQAYVSGQYVLGIALEKGESGQIISILVGGMLAKA